MVRNDQPWLMMMMMMMMMMAHTIACNFTVSLYKSKVLYAMLLMWKAILDQFISSEYMTIIRQCAEYFPALICFFRYQPPAVMGSP